MECNISSILDNLRLKDSRLPFSIKCELTYRCNFICPHCYCRLSQGNPAAKKELSFAEWDRILGESADEGALFLTFTGGEPLLRPDFTDIWRMAKRRGFLVSLFTNGSLITLDLVEFFQEWTPADISITIYGATENTYQAVTGVAGMLSKVTNNIDLLKQNNIPVSTRSIITKRNINEFRDLEQLNHRYSEFFSWDAELFGASVEAGGNPLQERLLPEEVVNLEFNHNDRKEGFEKLLGVHYGAFKGPENSYRCSMGKKGYGVDPYGYMHACMLLDPIKFDLRTSSVQDGWRSFIPDALCKLQWGDSPCRQCELAFFCCICPASSLREGAPQEGPTAYHCAIGKARYEKFKYCL